MLTFKSIIFDLLRLHILVVYVILSSEFVVTIGAKIDILRVVEAPIRKVVEAFVVVKPSIFISFFCLLDFSVIFLSA